MIQRTRADDPARFCFPVKELLIGAIMGVLGGVFLLASTYLLVDYIFQTTGSIALAFWITFGIEGVCLALFYVVTIVRDR